MGKTLILLSVAVVLSACAGSEDRRAVDQEGARQSCAALGFRPGTQNFAICVFRLNEHAGIPGRRS